MTDDEFDGLLTQAGARWRERNTSAAAVDLAAAGSGAELIELVYDEDVATPPLPNRRLWPWFVAASAALLLAFGVTAVVRPHTDSSIAANTDAAPYGSWRLISFTHATTGGSVSAPEKLSAAGPLLEITSASGKSELSADLGCGTASGPIEVTQDAPASGQIDFGELAQAIHFDAATKALGCGGPDDVRTRSIAALRAVFVGKDAKWRDIGTNLELRKGAVVLTYHPWSGAKDLTPVAPALIGTSWNLTNFDDGSGADGSQVGDASLQVASGGTFSGSDGCNSLAGKVTVAGTPATTSGDATGTAVFEPGVQTEIGCPSQATFVRVLYGDAPVKWIIYGGGKLAIERPGVGTLVFVRPVPTTSTPPAVTDAQALRGTSWVFSGYCDAGTCTSVSIGSGATPSFSFSDDRHVIGSYGCDTSFAGTATVLADSLAIVFANDASSADASACDGVGASLMWEVLHGPFVGWSLTLPQLTLSAGKRQLQFQQYDPTQTPEQGVVGSDLPKSGSPVK